jgi:hypothetical protein
LAADVTGTSGALPAQPESGTVYEPTPPPPSAREIWPHRHRFLAVYALLGVALGLGVAGIAVFANRSINPGPKWSSWQPHGGGLGAAHEIADHVAPLYRLSSGKQLVDVIAKEPSVSSANQTIPVHYVAIRAKKASADQIFPVSPSDSIMFSLCGLGQYCSIASGTASVARGRLVRREILELALYTFKYVGGVKNVIAFMPPRPGSQPQYVVYLTKDEFASELKVPLATTLASKTPLANKIPASEVRLVDATTEPRVFSFSLAQTQQGDAVLVLDPIPA